MGLSSIEWTDYTFNAWLGCDKVSRECKHCYITRTAPFRTTGLKHGDPRRRTSESNWKQPLAWNRLACIKMARGIFSDERPAIPRPRVFCNSLADWLDDQVPIEWLADLLKLIHDTPCLDWLLLTKRPENFDTRVQDILADCDGLGHLIGEGDQTTEFGHWLAGWLNGEAPANVWIGVTAGTQKTADENILNILEIPARVRFVSCEPLLEDIDIEHYLDPIDGGYVGRSFIDWVIGGGESGDESGVEPTHPEWARNLRDQCAAVDVPFFWKQWGEWLPVEQSTDRSSLVPRPPARMPAFRTFGDGSLAMRVGKKNSGRLLDGVLHDAFPEVD